MRSQPTAAAPGGGVIGATFGAAVDGLMRCLAKCEAVGGYDRGHVCLRASGGAGRRHEGDLTPEASGYWLCVSAWRVTLRHSRRQGRYSAMNPQKVLCLGGLIKARQAAVEQFPTRAAARTRVSAWIQDYNHNRRHSACQIRHSACQMMSPVDYERKLQAG